MSDAKRKIGLRADKIRVEKGMTIHEFCEKSGIGIKAATSFFSGKGSMRTDVMCKVAHALGCTVKTMMLSPMELSVLDFHEKHDSYINNKFPGSVSVGFTKIEITTYRL